jgi:hypothetical protein
MRRSVFCSASKGEMLALKKPVPVISVSINEAHMTTEMRKLADTEGQETDDEGGSGACLVNNNGGCRCSHEDYVSDDAYNDSDVDGLISAQMGICHIATNQGHEITSGRQNKAH